MTKECPIPNDDMVADFFVICHLGFGIPWSLVGHWELVIPIVRSA
jgi:hypothetical protein